MTRFGFACLLAGKLLYEGNTELLKRRKQITFGGQGEHLGAERVSFHERVLNYLAEVTAQVVGYHLQEAAFVLQLVQRIPTCAEFTKRGGVEGDSGVGLGRGEL